MRNARCIATVLTSAALLLACGTETDPPTLAFRVDRFDSGEWSDPVNLGSIVNSPSFDANPALSPDEHTLYFVSNRPGSVAGSNDLWASHRQCLTCPWETPYNLGAPINSAAQEGSATLSEDGKLLFFFTVRSDGLGNADIYVSHRISTGQDGDVWSEPENLGPYANSASQENGPYYTRDGSDAVVYFNRLVAGSTEIYKVVLSHDGVPLGPAVPVNELNDPAAADQKVTIREDGHELFMSTTRVGGFGNLDIWRSTRQTALDPWSTPTHLGAPINTPDVDSQPNLSRDGQTLLFTSTRTDGVGGSDIWMTTRRPGSP